MSVIKYKRRLILLVVVLTILACRTTECQAKNDVDNNNGDRVGGCQNFVDWTPGNQAIYGQDCSMTCPDGHLVNFELDHPNSIPPSSYGTLCAGITKTANPTTFSAAGQTITYSYLITNPTVDELNTFAVTDNKTKVNCPSTTVASRTSMTCTSTYTTTAADVANGSVTNKAQVGGGPTTGASASATVKLVSPPPTMTKTANPTTFSAAGQTITYSYVITNPGTTVLSAVSVTDDKATTVSCPATTMAAGASMTCTSTYTITAADVTAGSVTNTAKLSDASGDTPSASATVTLVKPVSMPSILEGTVSYCALNKTAETVNMNLPFNSTTNPLNVQTALNNGSLKVMIGNTAGSCTVDVRDDLMNCGFPASVITVPTTTVEVLDNNGLPIDEVNFDGSCPAPTVPNNNNNHPSAPSGGGGI
jgi:hypothetical protein